MNQQFFNALLDPELPSPSELTSWNGSDPAARFAVYRNNVTVSLINALADSYPVTQELVGEPFFRAMARLFTRQAPPRLPMLAFYGESFADFIETFPPAAALPYLADVARLEMLRVRAYHAADALPLPAETIAQTMQNSVELAQLKIKFHPSVGLLTSNYAAVSLWAAHQGIEELSTVDPYFPESALIMRPQLDVEVIRLNSGAGDFIARLLHGNTLGTAFEESMAAFADFDLADTLSLLIRTQAIAAMNFESIE